MLRHTKVIIVAAIASALTHHAWTQEAFERDGVTYTRVPWGIQRPVPELTEEETKRGWVTFVPGSQDGIGPFAYPTRSEIGGQLLAFAAPGEHEPVTFGVYAARDLKGVSARPGALYGPRGAAIKRWYLDVRTVRLWKQRTSWNSRQYHVIPELLETRNEVDIPAGTFQQYWVTVRVPGDTIPGLYEGYIRVAEGNEVVVIPIKLRVVPFVFRPVKNKVWGLWPDTSRWRRHKYTDEQILEELADWRSHGITSSLMYPLSHGKFSLEEGKLQVDLREFERYMDLYVRVGLRGPVVASFQGLTGLVHRLLGQEPDDYGPEFADLAVQIVRSVEDLRQKKNWPEFVYHTVDEPGGHAAVQAEAHATLKILHDAGFRTYTTADITFANEVLDPFLDVRCYSIGFCARSAEQAAARRAECEAAGDTYWWYGTGCYTGQEGSVAVNRHLGGFLLEKSGADGAWAWTFQRPKDSAYDDFDGQAAREQKDACITYPQFEGGPPHVPTLQWEGIREGVDDARYVDLLRGAIEELAGKQTPEARAMLNRAEAGLEEVLNEVPWLGSERLTNAQAQVLRWRICSLLLDSARALGIERSPKKPSSRTPVSDQIPVTATPQPELKRPQEASLPIASVPSLPRAPSIDGALEPGIWENARRLTDLVAPDGTPNAYKTEVWVARDRANLYVAFRCHEDQMDEIRAAVTEHDGEVWTDDSIEIFLDPDNDPRTYAHFMMNAVGTRRESILKFQHKDPARRRAEDQAKAENADWEIDWQGAASTCPEGWSAEVAIPIRALRGRGLWGANFHRTRRVPDGRQYACWSPTGGGYHVPDRFGKLFLAPQSVDLASVQLRSPSCGDNSLVLTLKNPEGFAEANVIAYVPGSQEEVSVGYCALAPGMNVLELSYDLHKPGANDLTIQIMPLTAWKDPGAANVRPGRSRGGRVRPSDVKRVRALPTRLTIPLWLTASLAVDAPRIELLQGWSGFDVTAALNLGRRAARGSTLNLTVAGPGGKYHESTLDRIEPGSLFLNVGTAPLPPGKYRFELSLNAPDKLSSRVRVPFEVIEGPWQ